MLLYKIHIRNLFCEFIPLSSCVVWVLSNFQVSFEPGPNLHEVTQASTFRRKLHFFPRLAEIAHYFLSGPFEEIAISFIIPLKLFR